MIEIKKLDHYVMTVKDVKKTVDFYTNVLGMRLENKDGRYFLYFANQKINIHSRPKEYLPAAEFPTPGSLDLCFEINSSIDEAVNYLNDKVDIECGPVERNGVNGKMTSIYFRDPDNNLIELCVYL